MTPELARALATSEELELVTRGRRTGRAHSVRLWFAHVSGVLWLRTDADSDWYRNLLREPACRIRVAGLEVAGSREPVVDEALALRELIDRWRVKYGAEWVADWYVERGRIPVRVRLGDSTRPA